MSLPNKPMLEALERGQVHVKYKSLSSGREIEDIFTLKGVNIHQNPENEKIVLLHVESNTYEDIQKNTIISWSVAGLQHGTRA